MQQFLKSGGKDKKMMVGCLRSPGDFGSPGECSKIGG
jgi:hypothetical protein